MEDEGEGEGEGHPDLQSDDGVPRVKCGADRRQRPHWFARRDHAGEEGIEPMARRVSGQRPPGRAHPVKKKTQVRDSWATRFR
jgi:hypothetical protein